MAMRLRFYFTEAGAVGREWHHSIYSARDKARQIATSHAVDIKRVDYMLYIGREASDVAILLNVAATCAGRLVERHCKGGEVLVPNKTGTLVPIRRRRHG